MPIFGNDPIETYPLLCEDCGTYVYGTDSLSANVRLDIHQANHPELSR
jgi:hypothetical protein